MTRKTRRNKALCYQIARALWTADGRPSGPDMCHEDYREWSTLVLNELSRQGYTLVRPTVIVKTGSEQVRHRPKAIPDRKTV